ncbi:MAG: recombination mediator RecR [Phycisphaerales bacterium JB043]
MAREGRQQNGKGVSAYPSTVNRLIEEFGRLPGIGRRTAERLAFHVLKSSEREAMGLAEAIGAMKRSVRHCSVCFNLTEHDPCPICADPAREHEKVLVVEQPKDLLALEQTGMYRGVYHVLLGVLNPLEGIEPGDLTIARLMRRLDDPDSTAQGVRVEELILGLNPTLEGDGTGLYLGEEAQRRGVKVSRLARGLPAGSQLEYANKAVLADAITGRQSME